MKRPEACVYRGLVLLFAGTFEEAVAYMRALPKDENNDRATS